MPGRRLALIAFVTVLVVAGLVLGAGEVLSRPAVRSIGPPPPDFPAQTVRLRTASGGTVMGWFARGQAAGGAVLLLHGVRADRSQMLRRARFLHEAGYATLLIDLPAHGESSGERITFGAREAEGVIAAIAHLRHALPGERIGIIGVSLGAASTVLASPLPAIDAVVLESMYPTLEEAVSNRLRMRLGFVGAGLAPLLLWQLSLRTGIHASDLQPITRVANLHAPVLVASGADDQHTPWTETQSLYDAAAQPKDIWRVEGAAHVDLHAHAPGEYQRRILRFLSTHLRNRA